LQDGDIIDIECRASYLSNVSITFKYNGESIPFFIPKNNGSFVYTYDVKTQTHAVVRFSYSSYEDGELYLMSESIVDAYPS
jgi:hypothetical protein